MVLAVAAASLALDAIQSLTSPSPPPSQRAGAFGPVLSDIGGRSPVSNGATTVSRPSGPQISSDNLNALLNTQSLTSANSANSSDANSSISDSSQTQSASASTAASLAYSAINQLTHAAALPLGLNPFASSA
jgi:hypothetical protein